MKAHKLIPTIIILVVGLLLWSKLGAKDTTAKVVVYPLSNYTTKVVGETYLNGRMYDVVETVRVNRHLRAKKSMKKNRYQLNLDK